MESRIYVSSTMVSKRPGEHFDRWTVEASTAGIFGFFPAEVVVQDPTDGSETMFVEGVPFNKDGELAAMVYGRDISLLKEGENTTYLWVIND